MYSQDEITDRICAAIMDGRSLRKICEEQGMPDRATVFRWLAADDAFATKYARARAIQAEGFAEELVEIADEEVTMVRRSKHWHGSPDEDEEDADIEVVFDPTAVARNKLRVATRQWIASKLLPKRYGDRTVLTGDPDNPVQINSTRTLTTAELMAIAVQGVPAK